MNEEKEQGEKKKTRKESVVDGSVVNLTEMVDRTAEQIAFLKKKQEELQGQKAELEELRRQRKELDSVKREVLTALERSIAVLDREESDLQRKHSLVKMTRREFDTIINEVRAIREETWQEENLKAELAQALAVVAKAKREVTVARGKIDALSTRGLDEKEEPQAPEGGRMEILPTRSGELFRRGLIFFLPAALLAVLVAALIRLMQLIE